MDWRLVPGKAGTLCLLVLLAPTMAGCARSYHRLRADRGAYRIVARRTLGKPWPVPEDFSLQPHRESRLYDPSSPDAPRLPPPGPLLWNTSVGQLWWPGKDRRPADVTTRLAPTTLPLPLVEPTDELPASDANPSEETWQPGAARLQRSGLAALSRVQSVPGLTFSLRRLPPLEHQVAGAQVRFVSYATQLGGQGEAPLPGAEIGRADGVVPPEMSGSALPGQPWSGVPETGSPSRRSTDAQAAVQPIPQSYWDALPANCLQRMLEFESVRSEYRQLADQVEGLSAAKADVRRLALFDIVQLARLHSREYQSQKEALYIAALDVALQRFDYDLKFSAGGINGVDVDYRHTRSGGTTVNRLAIPTSFQMDKMLSRGGTFVTRFANSVLLTFNGAAGFSSDISSELLFSFTQSVLQRDIQLESLVQSERNLVYAARDFARFRKELFFRLASQYYGLLRTYRSIEIESQNYFSLVRTVERARAEVLARVKNAPNQVAVDQFEQSMLSGRSSLISRCNDLEQSLDALKLLIGLPTEMTITLDLTELKSLATKDEAEVSAERVRRWQGRLATRINEQPVDLAAVLNAAVFVTERLITWAELQEVSGSGEADLEGLRNRLEELQIAQSRYELERVRLELDAVLAETQVREPQLQFEAKRDLIDAYIELIDLQLDVLARRSGGESPAEWEQFRQEWQTELARMSELDQLLAQVLSDRRLAGQDQLLGNADALLLSVAQLLGRIELRLRELQVREAGEATVMAWAAELLEVVDQMLSTSDTALAVVDIGVNDAMLTALVQRLDLMNERGFLADDRRRLKLAADDLRSVFNWNVAQSFRTRDDRPFEFSFDDSETRLGLTFDLPLNRFQQRVGYRRALITYQVGRRSLMLAEDEIKFAIRQGLRELEQTRVQYPISVTQAALGGGTGD